MALSAFCLLFTLLIWMQLASQLKADRKKAIDAAVQRNSNLAVSLEQYAVSTIRNADAVLQLVRKEYEEKGNQLSFATLFRRGIIDTNQFNGVMIIDSGGKLLQSNLPILANNRYEFSDRDYFRFHKQHTDSLHISHPLLSRTIGETVIVVSRRLSNRNGEFAGILALQIEPSTFTRFYAKADLRKHDIISLISPVGMTYARRTGNKESFGENISKSPLFKYVKQNPQGFYFAKDAIRGIPSYFSYRKLQDYPIIATVGSAESDILADYVSKAKRDYTFGGVITFLLLLFLFLISDFFINRQKYTRAVLSNELHYRSIFENSQDTIILVNNKGRVEAMNEAGQQLFRMPRGEKETLLTELFPVSSQFIDFATFMTQYPSKSEIEFLRSDGSTFTGEMVHSHFKDADGQCKMMLLVRDITLRKEMEKRLLTEQKRYQRRLTKQIISAQEREREKIGHELHDNVNQILTTVKLFLDMAHKTPDMREQLLPKSIGHIQECINEIRHLSHELSAPTLGTQSLLDSVKALVETVQATGRFAIDFNVEHYHTTLEKDQRLAIYRILQEQLNNIVKHANAAAVVVRLSQTEDSTHLLIKDNGRGFTAAQKRGGIGFNNMRSRAKVFGGEIWIDSSPGHGCTVRVSIPIKAEEESPVTEGEQI